MRTFEHVLELTPGETGTIEFRFPKDQRRLFDVRLAAADDLSGTVELVMDDMIDGYDMILSSDRDEQRPRTRLMPGDDGNVHATLDLNAGERVGITSDDQFLHTLSLVDASWQGKRLRLTFRELG